MKKLFYSIFVFLLLADIALLGQPNFQVKTINGFDNFKLGTNYMENFIATNPNNPQNTVAMFYTFSHSATPFAYYTLNGHDWMPSYLNWGYIYAAGDPFVAVDNQGNFYITVFTGLASGDGISVAKSTNGGISWSYHRMLEAIGVDKECIVGDITNGPFGGNLYAGWQGMVPGISSPVLGFQKSTSRGITWSAPDSIASANQNMCPYIAVGPNGSVDGGSIYYSYVSWDTSDFMTVRVKRSTDAGASFSSGVIAADSIKNPALIKGFIHANSCGQIAADNSNMPTRGNVYLVYGTNPPGDDRSDVYFTRSTNSGLTWENTRKLTDENTGTEQWMPAIACDKETGKVFITWFDSRFDPANIDVKLYATVSSDGGATFAPNTPVSNEPYRLSGNSFWGHYMGVSAIKNTSYAAWPDNRENTGGSYTAFYPDYAYTVSPGHKILGNNDSFNVTLKIPARNGPFNQSVKFTPTLEAIPPEGSISISFLNNRDSVTAIPDSAIMKVKTVGNVTPGRYRLAVTSRAADGVPVHKRYVDLLVNYSHISVGTNRNGVVSFAVNGNTYTSRQDYYFPNNTIVNVNAPTPQVVNLRKYDFLNWSDNGDTNHNVTLNNSYITLTANYKVMFRLVMDTAIGNTFGGNVYYDSAQTVNFGVLSRTVVHNGNYFRFAGWNGLGTGSYSSPDSTGNDTSVTIQMLSNISEHPRWVSLIGIQPVSTEIPDKFNLYSNYPNPFNPVTKIKFDIAKFTGAKLVIYDILGRVVETPVNEQLRPGRYEISFDASRYSSGVYFYRLVTTEYTDTKKMLLVK